MLQGRTLSVSDRLVLATTSVGGLGYVPMAPGTFGTLGALPLYALMSAWPWPQALLATLVMTLFAIFVSGKAERIYGGHDVQHIVIDEVVGLLWSVLLVPWRLPQVLVAFILFRLFDALKPWPISVIDRRVDGGLGVVLDDVAAGVVTCACMHGARLFLGGWW